MYGALFLFDSDFIHVVSITFTSVLLTELLMVALTIHTWHFVMILAELASLVIYVVALVVFKSFFGASQFALIFFMVFWSLFCAFLVVLNFVLIFVLFSLNFAFFLHSFLCDFPIFFLRFW